MSEELYNSNDFCKLAEEFEELKKENAELSRDKDRLMNLFMESSEYVFDTSANMKIESLTRKCKALEADYAVSNREMLLMQVEIQRLTAELDACRADAERFAEHYGGFDEGGNYCVFCGEYTEQDGITINHDNDCPITLHRQLVEKYGKEMK